MTDLVIRPFRETDESAVLALWNEAFPNDPPWNEPHAVLRRKLGVQRELFLVGERDGVVIATLLGGFDGFRGWLNHLAVAAAQRRHGHGRAMVTEAERLLRERGCPKINVQIRATNDVSVRFCQALGYAIEDRISLGKPLL